MLPKRQTSGEQGEAESFEWRNKPGIETIPFATEM